MADFTFAIPLRKVINFAQARDGLHIWQCNIPIAEMPSHRDCWDNHVASSGKEAELAAVKHLKRIHGLSEVASG